jgi:hypothetical protein
LLQHIRPRPVYAEQEFGHVGFKLPALICRNWFRDQHLNHNCVRLRINLGYQCLLFPEDVGTV